MIDLTSLGFSLYDGSLQVIEKLKTKTVLKLRPASIVLYQRYVSQERVNDYLKNYMGSEPIVTNALEDDKFLIIDGHHRLAAAYVLGKRIINIKMLTL